MDDLKSFIIKHAAELELDGVAFCNAKDFKIVLDKFPNAKSIISVCECYLVNEPDTLGTKNDPHGKIAAYTRRNYYKDVHSKLEKLAKFIKLQIPASQCDIFVNSSLPEKPIAAKSGLGFYGKNGIIYTKDFGSLVVLGEIVTNIEIEPDKPIQSDCGDCKMCLEACPTKAISRPYVLDRTKCIQDLCTKEKTLDNDIANVWKDRFYGCTTCQDVCPLNKNVKPQNKIPKFGNIGPSVSLIKILSMTDDEIKKYFKQNQIGASWVSPIALKRNALIALGNLGDKEHLKILEKFTNSENKILSSTAKWAANKLLNNSVQCPRRTAT